MSFPTITGVAITGGSSSFSFTSDEPSSIRAGSLLIVQGHSPVEITSITEDGSKTGVLAQAWPYSNVSAGTALIVPLEGALFEKVKELVTLIQTSNTSHTDLLASIATLATTSGPVTIKDAAGIEYAVQGFLNLGTAAGKNIGDIYPLHSSRQFDHGTLVKTKMPYPDHGDAWMMEVTGNSYGDLIPFDVRCQGYIYDGSMIRVGGISNGTPIDNMVVFSYEGNVCFWWPYIDYWQGFNVRFISTSGVNYSDNQVLSITNEVKPASITQEVAIPIEQSFSTASVEYGSNANGEYWKYPDGKLICKGEIEISCVANTDLFQVENLPAAFLSTSDFIIMLTIKKPHITNGFYTQKLQGYPAGLSAFNLRVNMTATQSYDINYLAIGVWK